MEMKKNLYYNNDQFYAAVFVEVDQILRLHSCEATLFRLHMKEQHTASRARNKLRGRVEPARCPRSPAGAALLRKQTARTPQYRVCSLFPEFS